MSSLQTRAAALQDRVVILAVRNAARIARRNPTAIVVDMKNHVFWQGDDAWLLNSDGKRGLQKGTNGKGCNFRYVLLLLTGHGRLVTKEDIWIALWGQDPTGGPLDPGRYLSVLKWRSQEFFEWLGLTVETRHGLGLSPVLAPYALHKRAA